MTLQTCDNFFVGNKETITIAITIIGGVIGVGTFIKAIFEYRLQGRQKRAELFDNFKNRLLTNPQLSRITALLEKDDIELKNVPQIDKYYFLGFFEQIAVAVNSGLIKETVAHYFFGYFARACWDSDNFWYLTDHEVIGKNEYYWATFKKFVFTMDKIAERKAKPNFIQAIYDQLFYKRLYRF